MSPRELARKEHAEGVRERRGRLQCRGAVAQSGCRGSGGEEQDGGGRRERGKGERARLIGPDATIDEIEF